MPRCIVKDCMSIIGSGTQDKCDGCRIKELGEVLELRHKQIRQKSAMIESLEYEVKRLVASASQNVEAMAAIRDENARLRRQVERLAGFSGRLIDTIEYDPTLEGSLQRQDFLQQLDAILADE